MLIGTVAGLIAGSPPLAARQPVETDPDALRIALVTMGPGGAIWERFGHNAIWVEDRARGTSRWYNYGMFSFRQERFLRRFIQGRMTYWMAAQDPDRALRAYAAQGRWVLVQGLNLTPDQRVAMRDFLVAQDTEEARYYRYHYYDDNCSTRVRDAIDLVLGGQLHAATVDRPTDTTFRFHTRRLTTVAPWLYTGLETALGPAVDRPLSAWDEMFLPLRLADHVRDLRVIGTEGVEQPLVAYERWLHRSDAWPVRTTPPAWTVWYLLVGLGIAAGLWGLRRWADTGAAGRVGFAAFGTLWWAVVGVAGVILAGLAVATDHDVAYWNENLFLANPGALVLAGLLPWAVAGRARARRLAGGWALGLAGVAALGFLSQALPWFDQVNGEIHALLLLPHLAFAAAIGGWVRASPGSGPDLGSE